MPPPRRWPPPANSSIRKPAATTSSRPRAMRPPRSKARVPVRNRTDQARRVRPGLMLSAYHWEIGGTGGPAGATGGGGGDAATGGAAGAGPPLCGSEAALDADVDAAEPLGLPPGAGVESAGLASPSGDFGAGVTAGTG